MQTVIDTLIAAVITLGYGAWSALNDIGYFQ